MQKVKSHRLSEGMVLAQDIINEAGNPIYEKGESLDSLKIQFIKNQGIKEVAILDNKVSILSDIMEKYNVKSPEELSIAIKIDFQRQFRHVSDNKIMMQIKEAGIRHLKKRLKLN
jgi:hypothetical protein